MQDQKKVKDGSTVNTKSLPNKKQKMIVDPMGQWAYPGQNTRIPGGDITMQGVPYPVYAQASNGMEQLMYPGQDYSFPGADYVDEYPMMQIGGVNLNLPNIKYRQYPVNFNFNYQKPDPYTKIFGMGAEGNVQLNNRFGFTGGANFQNVNVPIAGINQWTPSYNAGVTYKFAAGGTQDNYSNKNNTQMNRLQNLIKYADGSIVDYLAERGGGYSKERRAKLAAQKGIKDYDFSAEKNIELLNLLKREEKTSKPVRQKETPRQVSNKPAWTGTPYVSAPNPVHPGVMPNYPWMFPTYKGSSNKESSKPPVLKPSAPKDKRNLESGTIVDKATNTLYVINKGKIVKSAPVLTGQAGRSKKDPNKNPYSVSYLESHPEARSTPVGTYFMNPNADIYGWPGFNLNPIQAFGQDAPNAANTAMHITYGANPKPGSTSKGHVDPKEFKRRNAGYSMPGNQRYFSYGCTNMQGETIDCLQNQFPKGDTAVYVDSRNPMDLQYIKQMRNQKDGGSTYSAGVWYKNGGELLKYQQRPGTVLPSAGGLQMVDDTEEEIYKYNQPYRPIPFSPNPNELVPSKSDPAYRERFYKTLNEHQDVGRNPTNMMFGQSRKPKYNFEQVPAHMPPIFENWDVQMDIYRQKQKMNNRFMGGGNIPNYMQDPNPMYNFGGYFPQAPRFQKGGTNNNYIYVGGQRVAVDYADDNEQGYIADYSQPGAGNISEFLSSVGIDSGYQNRSEIARRLKIPNYSGTAAQNIGMYNTLNRNPSIVDSFPQSFVKKQNRKNGGQTMDNTMMGMINVFQDGGITEGQIMDVTPDMLEKLKAGGYTFEMIND